MKTPEEGWQEFLNVTSGLLPIQIPKEGSSSFIMDYYKRCFLCGIEWAKQNLIKETEDENTRGSG